MNPDLIIHNAKIYTVEPQLPWAEAVACHNGRFLTVGTNQEILPLAGPDTKIIDANGRLLLPRSHRFPHSLFGCSGTQPAGEPVWRG